MTDTATAPKRTSRLRAYLAVAALLLAAGLAAVGGHMATCEEDSCRIWVCSIQGNGICGPDQPAIMFLTPEE